MKKKKLFNVIEGFNFDLLNNPEFLEDSIREEIIVPIIKNLGYSANIPNQIIRSRKLLHPFVSIGSIRKKIHIIPDYLFEVNGKPAWILDAKSPTEDITKSKHVEQAYSYAIHSEVRTNLFALCNGREFALFDIQQIKPILHFPLETIGLYWDNLKRYLLPDKVFLKDYLSLAKDLGLHLKRLGFDKFDNLIFPDMPIVGIAQLDNNMFSISCGVNSEGEEYCVTFDFDEEILNQFHGKIPIEVITALKIRHKGILKTLAFGDNLFYVSVDCRIGEELQENSKEIFLPMKINKVLD